MKVKYKISNLLIVIVLLLSGCSYDPNKVYDADEARMVMRRHVAQIFDIQEVYMKTDLIQSDKMKFLTNTAGKVIGGLLGWKYGGKYLTGGISMISNFIVRKNVMQVAANNNIIESTAAVAGRSDGSGIVSMNEVGGAINDMKPGIDKFSNYAAKGIGAYGGAKAGGAVASAIGGIKVKREAYQISMKTKNGEEVTIVLLKKFAKTFKNGDYLILIPTIKGFKLRHITKKDFKNEIKMDVKFDDKIEKLRNRYKKQLEDKESGNYANKNNIKEVKRENNNMNYGKREDNEYSSKLSDKDDDDLVNKSTIKEVNQKNKNVNDEKGGNDTDLKKLADEIKQEEKKQERLKKKNILLKRKQELLRETSKIEEESSNIMNEN